MPRKRQRETEKERDGQRETERDRERQRETHTQTDKQTERDRETHRETLFFNMNYFTLFLPDYFKKIIQQLCKVIFILDQFFFKYEASRVVPLPRKTTQKTQPYQG